MKKEQKKLIGELRALLKEFKKLDEMNYHKRDDEYAVLLKRMEKTALRIHDDTIKELRMEDKELESIIRALRLKGTWMTFHGFRI